MTRVVTHIGETSMQHLAIIPDGNRRWAAQNKLESFFGHKKGLEAVRSAIKVSIKNGIKYLSFYTFSLENFKRGDEEKSYLFSLLSGEFKKWTPELITQKIRIKFLGDTHYFPSGIRSTIKELEEQTKDGNVLQLNLLFCYGAQQEIVSAVQALAQQVKAGTLDVNSIDVDMVKNSLWTAGMPDPDLVIRTGKVTRLSNFLLYQSAYSEYLFLDSFWPEMTEEILESCLQKFPSIKRNFGT